MTWLEIALVVALALSLMGNLLLWCRVIFLAKTLEDIQPDLQWWAIVAQKHTDEMMP